jgi:hypothetical protein
MLTTMMTMIGMTMIIVVIITTAVMKATVIRVTATSMMTMLFRTRAERADSKPRQEFERRSSARP